MKMNNMIESKILRPIKLLGWVFLFLAFWVGFIIFSVPEEDKDVFFICFFFIAFVLHFVMGLGLVLMKSWGYWLFIFWLRLMYLGYPLGTRYSKAMLKYMADNNIKDYYTKPFLEL